MLGQVVERAAAEHLTSVAVTFEPHPIAVLYPDQAPPMITSLAQRIELIESAGIEALVVLEFTAEFARLTPEEFVREVFVDALHAEAVVVGVDRGSGAQLGKRHTLRELRRSPDFEVLALVTASTRGTVDTWPRWSPRWCARCSRAATSRVPSAVSGSARRGGWLFMATTAAASGLPVGQPSQVSEGLIPADGVHAGWVTGSRPPHRRPRPVLPAATPIGTNPTSSIGHPAPGRGRRRSLTAPTSTLTVSG